MEHHLENKFLNKESAYKDAFKEQEDVLKIIQNVEELDRDDQFQIYESFIKERGSILGYVYEMVLYSAKKQEINALEHIPDKFQTIEQKLKNDNDMIEMKYRVIVILERYQEQPGVLDSILDIVVTPIMKYLRTYIRTSIQKNNHSISKDVSNLFEIINHLCKVRGYKTVIKFFPHEVADLEPVVELLHFQESVEWWIPYILILWLSLIILVPFDIETIDSKKDHEILVKRIINIGKNHISNSGKIREAAFVLLAKLLSRPDIIKSGETDIILTQLTSEYLVSKEDTNEMFHITGILQTLVEIFRVGHREDFLKRVDTVFDPILKSQISNKFINKSTVLRKLKVKLAQRIGCIFLKPVVAKWRYQRGYKSLKENLMYKEIAKKEEKDEDEEMMDEQDINYEQLEFIIQFLLESLKDEDTTVRWTSAKGLGRITGRLNKDFADQIVEQLYDLFDHNETDSSWHGGCLALAELCRRGLLLPERLTQYIPKLEEALIYDINRGNYSIGAHVRDAACYVVWSFARAYSPDIMKPHVKALSNQLIVVSLFDREVNCRRAASATFQECVGRQGNFPHGIEILTEADYFTLSNRVNAYLNVSCYIAQFPEYFESMVHHLAFIKLQHWESSIRMLAAQTLSVISSFNPQLMIEKALLPLIEQCYNKALHIRHGAILGVGEILIGLSGNSSINRKEVLEKAFRLLSNKERQIIEDSESHKKFKKSYEELSSKHFLNELMKEESEVYQKTKEIISKVEKLRLYRGKGGEIMRGGVCHLIQSMSLANIKFNSQEKLQLFQTLQENFKHPNIEIQKEACKAFKEFSYIYLNSNFEDNKELLKEIQNMFKTSLFDENIAITRGYNMVFGAFSKGLINQLQNDLIDTLIKNSHLKGKESDDAETRKYAVKSLISVVKNIGVQKIGKDKVKKIFITLYESLNDYQVDRRGDVGSWVRDQAMKALTSLIQLIVDADDKEIMKDLETDQSEFYEKFISALLQQLMEKIDKVREVAGRCLQSFFKFVAPKIVDFAEKDQLTGLFTQQEEGATFQMDDEEIGYLPWRNADFVFNSIKPFFNSKYSVSIFKGLITSSGGLSESTLKASSNSLFQYLSEISKQQDKGIQLQKEFLSKLIEIFENNLKDERVTVPLMKTIELLLTADYLKESYLVEELIKIHSITVQECNKSKNIVKLSSSAGVFASMIDVLDKELCQKCVRSLLFFLFHSYPKIRKLASEKLYTSLLSIEDFSIVIPKGEEEYEKAMTLLSETNWSDSLKNLTQYKEEIYQCFGLQPKSSVNSETIKESKTQ